MTYLSSNHLGRAILQSIFWHYSIVYNSINGTMPQQDLNLGPKTLHSIWKLQCVLDRSATTVSFLLWFFDVKFVKFQYALRHCQFNVHTADQGRPTHRRGDVSVPNHCRHQQQGDQTRQVDSQSAAGHCRQLYQVNNVPLVWFLSSTVMNRIPD